MADEVDSAQETSDLILDATIKALRSATKTRELRTIGECHWCSETFKAKDQRLFCDLDCEQDYQRSKKRGVAEE